MKSKRVLLVASMLTWSLAACAPTPTREGTGEYVDDAAITTKVKAALVGDPVTKARDIKVVTFKGKVQLSGFVDNQSEADRAIKLATEVNGVKMVSNDMRLK
jgi:osmotically-inducible protein OsmY